MSRRQADSSAVQVEYRRAQTRKFCRDDQWFFSSREGDHGPFDTEDQADEALEAYVELIDLRPENEGPVRLDDD